MIFKGVGQDRPYPQHELNSPGDWAYLPPRMLRLEELITTRAELDLRALLSEDSTFYGDIFCHVVLWRGDYYLEDGLHRALRAALQGRPAVHGRVLVLD
ncbi:type II toxin-antitoxin system VapB family antitoxin [soil metagenome]